MDFGETKPSAPVHSGMPLWNLVALGPLRPRRPERPSLLIQGGIATLEPGRVGPKVREDARLQDREGVAGSHQLLSGGWDGFR